MNQTNQQTNPTRGRQGIRSPKQADRVKKSGYQSEREKRWIAWQEHTRQSGRGPGKKDWYLYWRHNGRMSHRCGDGRGKPGAENEQIAWAEREA